MRQIWRGLHGILAVFILLAGSLATQESVSAASYCTPSQMRAIENRMHQLVNGARAAEGLNPLVRLQSIDYMAQDWSVTMARTGNFEHRSGAQMWQMTPGNPSGVSENILYTFSGSSCNVESIAQDAFGLWMNSPGHRDNILRPTSTHTGYGFYNAPNSSQVYGTHNFSTYYGSTPPTIASTTISPSSGLPGTIVTVSGQGYPSATRVDLLFGPSQRLVGYLTTNSNGSFVGRITVPDVNAGAYVIRARVQNGQTYQDRTFTVRGAPATLSLSPTTTGPAGVVAFSGTNFQPGERVDIRWGSAYGEIIGYVTARSDGSISGRVTVRATMSGTYRIVARGTSSSKAIGANVVVNGVNALVTVTPSTPGAGTVVSVRGQGFAPGEVVHITWNTHTGRLLGIVRAGADGTISGRITIPAGSTGANYVYARGQSSTVTVRDRVVVGASVTRMAVEAPHIALSQTNLKMGESAILSGRGFQPGESVVITTGNNVELARVTADDDGKFTAQVTIPDPVAWADQEQRIEVSGLESNQQVGTSFNIIDWNRAPVHLAPEEGPVGTTTTLTSTGFGPGEHVEVRLGESDVQLIAEGVADDQGDIAIELVIPDEAEGESIDLMVVGADGLRLGMGTFTIREATPDDAEATPTLTPEVGTPQPENEEVPEPTAPATEVSTPEPTVPDEEPTAIPGDEPPATPTQEPTEVPTAQSTEAPTEPPVDEPTVAPEDPPTEDGGEVPPVEPGEPKESVPATPASSTGKIATW